MPFPLAAIAAGASLLGPLMGKAGKGSADERTNQNNAQYDRDRLTQQGHQFDTQAGLQAQQQNERGRMDRAQLGISAPQARAKQALLASIMQNAQGVTARPPSGVNMGGGALDISAILNGLRGTGATLGRQANAALESGSDVPAFTDATASLRPSPRPSAPQQPGKFESLMSGGGLLASLLGSIAQMKKPGADTAFPIDFNARP